MASHTTPDQITKDLGGCGRYQMLISVIGHLMKVPMTFSVVSTIMMTFAPPWWCDDMHGANTTTYDGTINMTNTTDIGQGINDELMYGIFSANGTKEDAYFKQCKTPQGKACQNFRFEGISTLVSEFSLVCEHAYVPSLLMSIQGAGSLFGNLMAGHLSDLFGRKRPYFAAMALMAIANFVSYLSNTWTLVAVTRFIVGVAVTAFITTLYSLLSEFTLAQYRAWVIGFPSWQIANAMLVGIALLLQEWRHMQLANAILALICLLAWWVIPESFRWHLSHDRHETSHKILRKVAKTNKKPHVTMEQLQDLSMGDTKQEGDRKYTVLDIFKSKYLIRVTFLMSFSWFALGFITYGVNFGIKELSGNFYMNMFLFAITSIPSKGISILLENRIGRRRTAVLLYVVTAIGGFAAGVLHYIDTPKRGALVNGFAMLAHLGIATCWGVTQTMTIELYPTVIRSIGFGTLGVIARIGIIISPQFVFLSKKIPGIMFLVCGVIATLSVLTLLGLEETRNANLNDKISDRRIGMQENGKEKAAETHMVEDTV